MGGQALEVDLAASGVLGPGLGAPRLGPGVRLGNGLFPRPPHLRGYTLGYRSGYKALSRRVKSEVIKGPKQV